MYTLEVIVKEEFYNILKEEFDFENDYSFGNKGQVKLEMYLYDYESISYYTKQIEELANEEGFDVDVDYDEWEVEDPYRDYGVDESMFW